MRNVLAVRVLWSRRDQFFLWWSRFLPCRLPLFLHSFPLTLLLKKH